MIKSLIALSCVIAGVGSPSFSDRQYQHTENVGNTEVTYKYESNEVNSLDDLIIDNIYELSYSGDYNAKFGQVAISFEILRGGFFIDNFELDDVDGDDNYLSNCSFYFSQSIIVYVGDASFEFLMNSGDTIQIEDGTIIRLTSLDDIYHLDYSVFSYTDYNEIESVELNQATTIVGVINNFCETYLFKDIPLVHEITFTVGGQTISLMTYLVIIFGLITAVGLFILLICVFKWLFNLFAGCFNVR